MLFCDLWQSLDRGATAPQQTAEFAREMMDESTDWLFVSFSAGRLIDHGGFGGSARSSTSAPQIGHATTVNPTHQAALWEDLIFWPELRPRTKSINGQKARNPSVTAWWSRFGYLWISTKVAD